MKGQKPRFIKKIRRQSRLLQRILLGKDIDIPYSMILDKIARAWGFPSLHSAYQLAKGLPARYNRHGIGLKRKHLVKGLSTITSLSPLECQVIATEVFPDKKHADAESSSP